MSYYIPSRTYSRFSPIYYQQAPTDDYVPFTVKVLNAGTGIRIDKSGTPYENPLYYRLGNDKTWTAYTVGDTIYVDDTIAFSGAASDFSIGNTSYYKLVATDQYVVSGHLNSLINKSEDVNSYGFWMFFSNHNNHRDNTSYPNVHIIDASNLIFPSGTFGSHVFERMFIRCTALTASPQLPKLELNASQVYRNMFAECHSLVNPGAISAEIVGGNSMQYMFYNCSSLIEIPQFRPKRVDYQGCKQMFDYCSNLTSLNLQWDQLSSVQYQSFNNTFSHCTSLVSVSGSVGTSDMTIDGSENFIGLFRYDSALVDATHFTMNPMNISGGGTTYGRLFRQCTSLTGAPNLPATGLFCQLAYNTMFYGCSSLKDAPYLPVKTPSYNCYNSMFRYCSSLTGINVALTSWVDPNGSIFGANWVEGVAANGTFTKPMALSEQYGVDNIPQGWRVVNSDQPPVDYTPFSLQAINGGGSVRLVPDSNPGPIVLDYKVNDGSWSSYTIGDTINLNENDIVYMSGANVNFSDGFGDYKGRYIFNLGGNIKAAGNIQSLVNFSDTCTDYCFNGLFGDQTLVDASELSLPATNLGMWAYNSMFSWTPLTAAPSCLPATSISGDCYNNMFGYCMSLTSAPQIMATSPNSSCGYMFMGCSSLTSITVHFTDWGTNGIQNWVQSLPANGTFNKPAALSEEYGDNYIPQGWTVVDI